MLKLDCLIDDRKKIKSLVYFKRRSRVGSKVEEDKQLKLRQGIALTLKLDCLIDAGKKAKSIVNFKRRLRVCSKVEEDKTAQTCS